MAAFVPTNPYCDIYDVTSELKMPAASVDADTDKAKALKDELWVAIENASRWVDEYRGRDYFQHDYSSSPLEIDQFSKCVFGGEIILPFSPVISVTQVKVGETVLTTDDYAIRDNRIFKLSTTFFEGCRPGQRGNHWNVWRPGSVFQFTGKLGYAQAASSDIPTGIPQNISFATRLVAAAFSGHNRKEVPGLDGSRTSILTNRIPETVFSMLGRKARILI